MRASSDAKNIIPFIGEVRQLPDERAGGIRKRIMKKLVILLAALCLAAGLRARAEDGLPVLHLEAAMLDYVAVKPGRLWMEGFSSPVTVKYRGTYSVTFTGKRNYTLHLKTEQGEQRKASLLGLRRDDDYVLLGGLSDGSRLRNPVGLALWRELGYPAPDTAACELYFGDYYKGIYFLTERPDRKSAGLPREGALYRVLAAGVDGVDLLSSGPVGAPADETWYNIGKIYPEEDEGWQPLSMLLAAKDKAPLLNGQAFADYYLFVNLIGATDNMEKNLYLCWDGRRFFPMPWDLDAAFGRLYNAEKSDAAAWYTNGLFAELMRQEAFHALLAERWQALREVLSPDHIMARFEAWDDRLTEAGAWEREIARFPDYTDSVTGMTHPLDPEAELAYIRQFITQRWQMLEDAWGGAKE